MAAPAFQGTQNPDQQRAALIKALQDQGSNESGLTLQELQSRLSDYNQLLALPGPITGKDSDKISQFLQQRRGELPPQYQSNQALAQLARDIAVTGDAPGSLNNTSQVFFDLNQGLKTGSFNAQPGDVGATKDDVSRVSGLISGIQKKNTADSRSDQFLSDLPNQLAANTDQYTQGLANQAQQTLEQQLIPESLQGLNSRGLIDAGGTTSGDLEASLVGDVSGAYQSVQDAQLQAQAADAQFYQDAAYQTQLRKELEASGNLEQDVLAKQQDALTQQSQRFTQGQTALNQDLNTKLFNKQQQRLLVEQANAAKQNQGRSAGSRLASAGVGAATGAAGGALIGGPIGAVVGGVAGGLQGGLAS